MEIRKTILLLSSVMLHAFMYSTDKKPLKKLETVAMLHQYAQEGNDGPLSLQLTFFKSTEYDAANCVYEGQTLLHSVLGKPCAQLLLKHKANQTAPNKEGRTPLVHQVMMLPLLYDNKNPLKLETIINHRFLRQETISVLAKKAPLEERQKALRLWTKMIHKYKQEQRLVALEPEALIAEMQELLNLKDESRQ